MNETFAYYLIYLCNIGFRPKVRPLFPCNHAKNAFYISSFIWYVAYNLLRLYRYFRVKIDFLSYVRFLLGRDENYTGKEI